MPLMHGKSTGAFGMERAWLHAQARQDFCCVVRESGLCSLHEHANVLSEGAWHIKQKVARRGRSRVGCLGPPCFP